MRPASSKSPPNLTSVSLNGQELQIFRAGNYGAKGAYTAADLQQLASDYDPVKHEAPLVIGHPKVNAPAFGWLKSVRADGDTLFGTFEKVPPIMDRLVDSGAYTKRSIALRRLPTGKLEIRHVGYLGAMPPEVQGLMDATFSGETFEEIEFSNQPGDDMALTDEQLQTGIAQGIKDFFSRTFGGQTPTSQFSASDLTALEQRIDAKFTAQIAAKDARIAELESKQATFASEHAKTSTQQRIDTAVAKLKADKRWLPAFDRMGALQVFAALGASTTTEIEFSSGEGEKKKTEKFDPIASFARFLEGLGQIVPEGREFSGEVVHDGQHVEAPKVDGTGVEAGSVKFDAEIKSLMTRDKISYQVAMDRLTSQGKSSASYSSTTSGAV